MAKRNSDYNEILKERDEALKAKAAAEEKALDMEKRFNEVSERLVAVSMILADQVELTKPLTHNSRGAGRKKGSYSRYQKRKGPEDGRGRTLSGRDLQKSRDRTGDVLQVSERGKEWS